MDRVEHPWAIRLYAGEIGMDRVRTTKGKSFYLLNLPYYGSGQDNQRKIFLFTEFALLFIR